MGFFRYLWDEALPAAPTSDPGVGKFRRYNSLISRRSNNIPIADNTHLSRSITILRTNTGGPGSTPPSSPAVSTAAGSPFSPDGGDLTRGKSTTDHRRESKSPTGSF